MSIIIHGDNPPTSVPVVALKKVGFIGGGGKDIVTQELHDLTTIGRTHRVASSAKECLCRFCTLALFMPLSSLISIIHPLLMVSTFSLPPLAKEKESLNHLSSMVLKKVFLPMPCGPGKVST